MPYDLTRVTALGDTLGQRNLMLAAILDVLQSGGVKLAEPVAAEYETIAASQTDQVMGTTGATGDYFDKLLLIPASTSPGAASIKDGAGSAITVFAGGASSLTSLVPFTVPVSAFSRSGAWSVTLGANISALALGNFT